jgi:hypothetical protein
MSKIHVTICCRAAALGVDGKFNSKEIDKMVAEIRDIGSELFIIHMIMEWVGVALYSGCFRDQRYISVANYCIKVTKARLVSVQIG